MLAAPAYAKPIIAARRRGEKPGELVIVSDGAMGLHRQFPQNHVVVADRHDDPSRFDWSFLNGLDVEVATATLDAQTFRLIDAILGGARPHYLRVRHTANGLMHRIVWNYTRDFRPETDLTIAYPIPSDENDS